MWKGLKYYENKVVILRGKKLKYNGKWVAVLQEKNLSIMRKE